MVFLVKSPVGSGMGRPKVGIRTAYGINIGKSGQKDFHHVDSQCANSGP